MLLMLWDRSLNLIKNGSSQELGYLVYRTYSDKIWFGSRLIDSSQFFLLLYARGNMAIADMA